MPLNLEMLTPLQVQALELRETAIKATTTFGRLWLQRRPWRGYLLTPYMPRYIQVPPDNELENASLSCFVICRWTGTSDPGSTIIAHHENGSKIPFEQISLDLRKPSSPVVDFQKIGSLDNRPIIQGNMDPNGEEAASMVGALSTALSVHVS